ncbi:hypothetical protein [Bartonella machadoae]|uniref:hypothetical protein n=1 Tax=Bartonella machadoae TaxID=2893471 RepID=UPI001F4C7AF9|nr:hypothetical protein [Bartonella machadoae]UNE53425.1 hypothetical protein LNM86_06980 [Bartonella machadoae]
MKENNMINFKSYSKSDPFSSERNFLKKVYYSIKEPAFIGALNGSVSGAIASILATYGYISLPGFGPIIAMGVSIAFFTGTIIGVIIGSIIGIFVGTFCTFLGTKYTL